MVMMGSIAGCHPNPPHYCGFRCFLVATMECHLQDTPTQCVHTITVCRQVLQINFRGLGLVGLGLSHCRTTL